MQTKLSSPVDQIRSPVDADMARVDILIADRLRSEIAFINLIGERIINSGGKRLRPLLVLLAATVFGYQGRDHVALAAIIEFIHTGDFIA